MKKIINHFPYIIPLIVLLLIAMGQTACNKTNNGGGVPSISQVRNYAASPFDTIISVANPGQWIVIQGTGLSGTQTVYFDGFPATFNNALQTDVNMVVQIPSALALGSVDSGKINTLSVVTSGGQVTYQLKIVPPAPIINSVSNEMVHPGDTLNIYGYNYFFIKSLTLPGNLAITNYTVNATGTIIHFTVPSTFTKAGPIILATQSGIDTTKLILNDQVTGMLCNFDNINTFDAGSSSCLVSNDAVAYPNGYNNYARMTFAKAGAGDWGDGNSGRRLILNAIQWVPVANVGDPTANWAVKFEIFVKNPWTAGCIFIQDWNWNHTCRFEPWLTATGGVMSTTGWQTITLPLTNFKTKTNGADGTGDAATTVGALIGATGNARLAFLFDNPAVDVLNFDIAIDNIRIVKIN